MNRMTNGTTVSDNLPMHVERPETELIPQKYTFAEMEQMSTKAAKSGLFNSPMHTMTPDQAFVLMLIADADGIPPIRALMKYHVIEGRPSLKADAALADFQRIGGRHKWILSTATEVKAEFWHPIVHPDPFPIHLTFKQFHDNGTAIARDGKVKKNWYQNPGPMLRARAITQGVRGVYPGIMVGIYCEEEIDREEPEQLEDSSRSKLLASLKAQKTSPAIETTATVVQATPEPKAATVATKEPEPKKDERSEMRKWVDQMLENADHEIAGYDPHQKPIDPNQVINHVLNELFKTDHLKKAEHLKSDGKRDMSKCARSLNTLWGIDPVIVQDLVGSYLAGKVQEVLPRDESPVQTGTKQKTMLGDDDDFEGVVDIPAKA